MDQEKKQTYQLVLKKLESQSPPLTFQSIFDFLLYALVPSYSPTHTEMSLVNSLTFKDILNVVLDIQERRHDKRRKKKNERRGRKKQDGRWMDE